jgi:hypothetical protein
MSQDVVLNLPSQSPVTSAESVSAGSVSAGSVSVS